MKKGLLLTLMIGASACLSTQEKGKTEGKAYTVGTNHFGVNWFISGGVGGQMHFGDDDDKANFGKHTTPVLDIVVGKWSTPGIGLRVAYSGPQAKGTTPSANDLYTKGSRYSNGYYKQKWNMANFHGGALLNLFNMFCGYNGDRLYPFIPYVGTGVALSWSGPHQQDLGISAGLISHFRVSDAWDINPELRGLLMEDASGGTSREGVANVAVGAAYKLEKHGFNATPTVPMVPESQLDNMGDRLDSLKSENESLERDLAEARNKKPEVVIKKEGGFVPRLVVIFNIGKSNINKREYMNIEVMVRGIEANPEEAFVVTGHADKDTSPTECNMKLSKKRAEAICNLMVNEFGVSVSQLRVDCRGGIGNMFYDDAKSSRVTIVEG